MKDDSEAALVGDLWSKPQTIPDPPTCGHGHDRRRPPTHVGRTPAHQAEDAQVAVPIEDEPGVAIVPCEGLGLLFGRVQASFGQSAKRCPTVTFDI